MQDFDSNYYCFGGGGEMTHNNHLPENFGLIDICIDKID
jgi:hypothetical protein